MVSNQILGVGVSRLITNLCAVCEWVWLISLIHNNIFYLPYLEIFYLLSYWLCYSMMDLYPFVMIFMPDFIRDICSLEGSWYFLQFTQFL